MSVVNGAQTVGLIGSFAERETISADAQVQIRLISLEGVPDQFDARITRATNTQNRIEGHDFAALDPNQRRLAAELRLDELQYAYKTGEPTPDDQHGFTLLDATVALACSQDEPSLAVQVKNQIGRIFDDLASPPYTLLFNDSTDARQLWRRVQIMRSCEEKLRQMEQAPLHRAQLIAVHGNRFLLHRVYQRPEIRQFVYGQPLTDIRVVVGSATQAAFNELAAYLNGNHLESYLSPLFKNRQKCREIVWMIDRPIRAAGGPEEAGGTAPLFVEN